MAKKYIPTSVYLNPEQQQWVKNEAWKARITVSEFMRRKILGENYRNENAA